MPSTLFHHPAHMRSLFLTQGGFISATIGKVSVYIDTHEEISFIQTQEGFDMATLKELIREVKRYGFEVLGENEAPAEVYDDGRVRHWLAQYWFPEEESKLPTGKEMVA